MVTVTVALVVELVPVAVVGTALHGCVVVVDVAIVVDVVVDVLVVVVFLEGTDAAAAFGVRPDTATPEPTRIAPATTATTPSVPSRRATNLERPAMVSYALLGGARRYPRSAPHTQRAA